MGQAAYPGCRPATPSRPLLPPSPASQKNTPVRQHVDHVIEWDEQLPLYVGKRRGRRGGGLRGPATMSAQPCTRARVHANACVCGGGWLWRGEAAACRARLPETCGVALQPCREVLEGASELRILLCKEVLTASGAVKNSVVAACGAWGWGVPGRPGDCLRAVRPRHGTDRSTADPPSASL